MPEPPAFAVTAMPYRRNKDAAAAFERLQPLVVRWNGVGDSLYRCTVNGAPTVAILTWRPTGEHLAAIATLPWGADKPVALPSEVCQQLAARSQQASPKRERTIRRVYRDPTGAVLRDAELPDE